MAFLKAYYVNDNAEMLCMQLIGLILALGGIYSTVLYNRLIWMILEKLIFSILLLLLLLVICLSI